MQSSQFTAKPSEATAPTEGPINVALVEDIREVREGLAALINGTRGFKCVGTYHSMEAALSGIGNQAPDVILTDIGLPGMSGIRGAEIATPAHGYTILKVAGMLQSEHLNGLSDLWSTAYGIVARPSMAARRCRPKWRDGSSDCSVSSGLLKARHIT